MPDLPQRYVMTICGGISLWSDMMSAAFARAYNLKTHIQTHDPNRLKPYACHHKSCGRSFSRKHDLTRHMVSIHRAESVTALSAATNPPRSIGVDSGRRAWCDHCGRSWVGKGKEQGCECNDVK